mmetsp:Transcript_28683/g.53017  ORF Transcript_28683/g.53017 Transcript_28683/m.53017 type:complete len:415 (-) Transcript_28683:330-1574(-)
MERIGCRCFMAILVAWLSDSGSAFQQFNHRSQTTSTLRLNVERRVIGFQRDHYRQDRSNWKPLFGRPPKDASIVAENEDFLTGTLGFSEDKLKKPTTKRILTLENGVLEERVDWLKERLKLNTNEIKKMAQSHPGILGKRSKANLIPKLDYLQTRLLLDEKSLRKIILRAPFILGSSTEDNIIPKLDYLQKKLLLDDESLRKIILVAPHTLGFSIEDSIEPKLDWLQQRLILNDAKLAKIITRFPTIMQYSIKDNIEPKLDWLQQRLDLDDAAVGKMIQRLPSILGSSIPNKLEPTMDWLQQRLSLTDGELSNLIKKCPSLLGYSVDTNIEPTLNFFIEALGDEGEALTLLIRSPDLFSRSLEGRLKPRLEEAQAAGMIINVACLKRIGKYVEKEWHTSLDFQSRRQSTQEGAT